MLILFNCLIYMFRLFVFLEYIIQHILHYIVFLHRIFQQIKRRKCRLHIDPLFILKQKLKHKHSNNRTVSIPRHKQLYKLNIILNINLKQWLQSLLPQNNLKYQIPPLFLHLLQKNKPMHQYVK